MSKMLKLLALASACGLPHSTHAEVDPPKAFSQEAYLEDFEALKSHISKTYANLEYLIRYYRIDPYALNMQTVAKIKDSQNDHQALRALRDFVAVFKDGHFRLNKPKEASSFKDKPETPLSNVTSPKQACTTLGFRQDKEFKFGFPVKDLHKGGQSGDEFPHFVVKHEGEKIGFLRVATFRDSAYLRTCMNAWNAYKDKFKGSCDQGCREQFHYFFMRDALIDSFYRALDSLRAEGIASLVVDLSGNGGGNDWVEGVTALLTTKPIVCSRRGFIKHPHHVRILKEALAQAKENPNRDLVHISSINADIKVASEKCDRSHLWSEKYHKLKCSLVGYHKSKPCKYGAMKFSGKRRYDGKLFFLVNGYTASAAEDIVARHLDSKSAVIIGSPTHGSGCGYTNGGIKYKLPNTGLEVQVPDCVRERTDGTNEVVGIQPDIFLDTQNMESPDFMKLVITKIAAQK